MAVAPTPTGILDHVRTSCARALAAGGPVRLVPDAVDAEARLLLDDEPAEPAEPAGTGGAVPGAGAAGPWAVAGADVEARIGYGIRPLMLAAGYGETAVVQALLDAGADVTARNDGGLTALMMVKEKFYVDVINLLTEAERDAGAGEGSCATKHAPGSSVVTFRKPLARS